MAESTDRSEDLERLLAKERAMRQQAEDYVHAILDAMQDAVLVVDAQWRIEVANQAAMAMTRNSTLQGRPILGIILADDVDDLLADKCELGLVRSDRSILAVRVTRREVVLDGAQRHILVIRDLTEERATANALRRTAFMDQLTGLGNRVAMVDRYESRIAADDARTFAVVVFDIQRFGRINDALGRSSADLALREVALRLRDHARATLKGDARLSEFMVARIGGDEFAILARGREVESIVDEQIPALLDVVKRPFTLAGVPIALEMHVGYCFGEEAVDDITTVLDHAVYAVETVADRRVDAIAEYQSEMGMDRRRVVGMEGRILRALESGEFHVYFQPRVDLTSGRIVSAEALLRWHHPVRGVLLPGEFIPVAEQSALIVALGDLVLDRSLALAQRAKAYGIKSHISVNVSSVEFTMLGFVAKTRDKVLESGLDPSLFEFEIKESVIASDVGHALEVIDSFAASGFSMSLDDFGTGQSSLNRLTELHVDVIKLDQRFMWGATSGIDGRKILEALVALADAVGAVLVVEGAETDEHIALLNSIGVRYVQGFAFSPAVDEETYLAYLASQPWVFR